MKTLTLLRLRLGFIALCPVTVALLMAAPGSAATPDNAPARSVKNLKLKVSANGRYLVNSRASHSSTSATPAGCSSSGPIARKWTSI